MNKIVEQLTCDIYSIHQNEIFVERKGGNGAMRKITGKLVRKALVQCVQTEFLLDIKELPTVREVRTRKQRAVALEREFCIRFQKQFRLFAGINDAMAIERPISWESVEARIIAMLANQFCPETVELYNLQNGVVSTRIHSIREKLGCPQLAA